MMFGMGEAIRIPVDLSEALSISKWPDADAVERKVHVSDYFSLEDFKEQIVAPGLSELNAQSTEEERWAFMGVDMKSLPEEFFEPGPLVICDDVPPNEILRFAQDKFMGREMEVDHE